MFRLVSGLSDGLAKSGSPAYPFENRRFLILILNQSGWSGAVAPVQFDGVVFSGAIWPSNGFRMRQSFTCSLMMPLLARH